MSQSNLPINTKLICEYLGGSRGYGLETETSDYDYRGVFIHTDPSRIIGLDRYDHFETTIENKDIKYKELREWFNLLRRANTEALECLFNQNWIFKDKIFDKIISNRWAFVDNKRIFSTLLGYAASELKLANGERTGKLGSKRKEAIDKYRFSPNNFVNYFRLLFCGIELFRNSQYIVNFKNSDYFFQLSMLKKYPEQYDVKYLNELAAQTEKELKDAYNSCRISRVFDIKLANEIIREIYIQFL